MTKRKWYKGPPPHVGWWNASLSKVENVWRWWDGKSWSIAANESDNSKSAAERTEFMVHLNDRIEWSDYYPKNARVPRIDPSKGESK